MKKIFPLIVLAAIVAIGPVALAQEDEKAPMWESMYITPDNTKLKELTAALAAHNKKYHNEDPYKATVYTVSTGPNIGKIVWEMGPVQFTHLDSRPSEDGHDEDWQGNVMQYVEKLGHGEYWRQDKELSNVDMLDGDPTKYPMLHITYHEVKPGVGNAVNELLKQVSETIKGMEGDNPWGVYQNLFWQGNIGRHLATVGFSKNWAEYDEEDIFESTFKVVHGEDAWQPFLDKWTETFADGWDEIWVYSKEMSGD